MNVESSLSAITEQPVNQKSAALIAGRFSWQPTIEFLLAVLLIGDALVIFGALSLAFWLRFDLGIIPISLNLKTVPAYTDYLRLITIGTAFLLVTFGYIGLYDRGNFTKYLRVARVIVQGMIFWFFIYLAVQLILKFDPPISRLFMVTSFVSGTMGMLAWRFLCFRATRCAFFSNNFKQRVLFVGWSRVADRMEKEIQNDSNHPYEIVGCLSSPQGRFHRQLPSGVPYLGEYYHLDDLLCKRRADIVILADPYIQRNHFVEIANKCEMEFINFKVIPSYFQTFTSGLRLESINGIPILGVTELRLDNFISRLIKRTMDIAGATVGLIASIPLMLVFGFLVYQESPGPILYRQIRAGRNGREFHILKIRSMKMHAEKNGAVWTKENDPRRLRVGAFMRKWNIDEVPQFINVLMGDMSLIGPRPERPELIAKFKNEIPHYHARHTCLPGMTGWAQVNGWRGNTSLEERIRFDIWYVENWSLALDLRILILTFLRQKNAY